MSAGTSGAPAPLHADAAPATRWPSNAARGRRAVTLDGRGPRGWDQAAGGWMMLKVEPVLSVHTARRP